MRQESDSNVISILHVFTYAGIDNNLDSKTLK